jgi:hypothetical protein
LRNAFIIVLLASIFVFSINACSQNAPAIQPNTDPAYQQLRNVGLGSESITVNNVVLKRDAATFTLKTGTVCFFVPVNGKVTGAIFTGQGSVNLVPPIAVEKRSISYLTKEQALNEDYNELLLRFTDATYDELKKAPGANSGGVCSSGMGSDVAGDVRKKLKWNLAARLLQDVYRTEPGGLFVAFVRGQKYNKKELLIIDPYGAPMMVAPEEVEFLTYDENKFGIWAAFHYSSEYAGGKMPGVERNSAIDIQKQQLDTRFEKSGKLLGKATTTFISQVNGLRVIPFDLFPTLRVESVTDAAGTPLNFIQEDKDNDADYWVILPKPLAKGENTTITTVYAGKDAVSSDGSGNYYPVARYNWYPNQVSNFMSDFAQYEMRFMAPKDLKLVATGERISEVTEGPVTVSQWRSPQPQTVAGFHFGKFKREQKQVDNFNIETYANTEPPGYMQSLKAEDEMPTMGSHMNEDAILGTLSTVGMMQKAMAEAELAQKIYTDFYGPSSFKRIAMTQQAAPGFGQSWPELVWLPITYFLDDTTRFQIMKRFYGNGFDTRGYFKVVGPHEIAHQWFGHTVTWASYRDQWMSEGFAEQAALTFVQYTRKPGEYVKFWNDERDLMIEKNAEGFRAIDVGPVTLGYRLNNTRVGDVTYKLIYPKGAYILHMIRMMMYTPKEKDARFKAMMHEFMQTYANRAATTEDFKSMVEKHMLPIMDLDGNRKMDWFFNEYVYGTALPSYKVDYSFGSAPDGTVTVDVKVTQSGVDDNFRMIVPVYLEMNDGGVIRLGQVSLNGNSFKEAKGIKLSKEKPKRILLNYFDDVLCDKN